MPEPRARIRVAKVGGRLQGKLYFALRRGTAPDWRATITGMVNGSPVQFEGPGSTMRILHVTREDFRPVRGDRRFIYRPGGIYVEAPGCLRLTFRYRGKVYRIKAIVTEMSEDGAGA
jgi:hypothetical protein